jgi:uncharacterized protein with FMN-binding domain
VKRVLLSITGTVIGVVALLSFKSSSPVSSAGGLPTASLPGTSSSSTATSTTPSATATSSAAPPDPSSGASSPTATRSSATAKASATARSYVGSSITTRYGIVQVKVTVVGSKITDVGFAQLTAFDGRSQRINSQAAPILLQETLQAQSARIDSVSGASYTSQGYVQSLQSALDQAGI